MLQSHQTMKEKKQTKKSHPANDLLKKMLPQPHLPQAMQRSISRVFDLRTCLTCEQW